MRSPPPPVDIEAFARPVKRAIVGQVRALFNDVAAGETPVVPSDASLFPPGSVVRTVHGDVTAMMIGGIASLLMQALHPAVLAGVWDHSNFRTDMLGRLRRTARFIALTTYGPRADAEAAIARVRAIHGRVAGTLPDGRAYRAEDPRLLAWVHVTETRAFLDASLRYGGARLGPRARDAYFAEMARVGEALGADPVPRGEAEASRIIAMFRPGLKVDARTREIARLVLAPPGTGGATAPMQRLAGQAAVDLLPGWARRMHGLPNPPLARPIVRASAAGIARTLRWAFR